MAAFYFKFQEGDIFKTLPTNLPAMIEGFPTPSSDTPMLITGISVGTTETMQFFLTFDDIIHYMWFGKGLGSATISGVAFMGCDGKFSALEEFYAWVAKNRGEVVKVSLAPNQWFSGPLTDSNCEVMAEPTDMANWSVTLRVTDHSLKKQATLPSGC